MTALLPFPVDSEPVLSFRVDCHPRGKAAADPYRTGPKCVACGKGMGPIHGRKHLEDNKVRHRLGFHGGEARFRAKIRMLNVPLVALIIGLWPRLKTHEKHSHKGRFWRPKIPDFDNLAKLVCDGLNAVVWTDDKLIVFGGSSTEYAAAWEKPGIEVHLWRAPPFPTGILAGTPPEGWTP